eukprot:757059-Hanusia_phi.AAC.3
MLPATRTTRSEVSKYLGKTHVQQSSPEEEGEYEAAEDTYPSQIQSLKPGCSRLWSNDQIAKTAVER